MTEENEESSVMFAESKFMRTLLVVIAALMIFAGPTYFAYILVQIVKVEYFASMAVGFVVFIIGIVFMYYLVRRKVIS